MEELKHAQKVVVGTKNDDGSVEMTYGALMKIRGVPYDLFARLKTGRHRGIFDFQGQFLMQGVHNNVIITCLKPDFKADDE